MEVPHVGQQREADMAVNCGHWPEAADGQGLVAAA